MELRFVCEDWECRKHSHTVYARLDAAATFFFVYRGGRLLFESGVYSRAALITSKLLIADHVDMNGKVMIVS